VDAVGLAAAALAGLGGGFVNTLAGAGSMVMVPALMVAGVPADLANATSRVPIFAQCLTSTAAFARAGRLERGPVVDVAPLLIVGALAGSYVATLLPNRIFEPLLMGTMLAMAILMVLGRDRFGGAADEQPRTVMGSPASMAITLLAGFYGGLIQAGAGFVLLALLGGLLRYDLVRANALKAVVMLSYIVVTVAVFAARDMIVWAAAGAMTVGSVLGAWLGAKAALGKGSSDWIRWLVIVMVLASCVWLFVR
jgi:uncharacterized membrane protein YfcA